MAYSIGRKRRVTPADGSNASESAAPTSAWMAGRSARERPQPLLPSSSVTRTIGTLTRLPSGAMCEFEPAARLRGRRWRASVVFDVPAAKPVRTSMPRVDDADRDDGHHCKRNHTQQPRTHATGGALFEPVEAGGEAAKHTSQPGPHPGED